MLSLLLLEAGRPLDADLLIDRFWGEEPPATARAALQTHISQLRQRLGEGIIATSGSEYHLDLRGHHLDSQLFEALASASRTALRGAVWEEVASNAQRALSLWRGPAFVELQDDDFAAPEIARLEELRLGLIEMRAESLLALGRTEEALPDLEQFTVANPLRERLWEHLMVARARLGRVTESLEAYHEVRAILDELGLEPAPRLRKLEERILQEDPVLVPPRIRNNLPLQLTSFVGRDVERTELSSSLAANRLVTLTGVGGSGKTRLALEVARACLDEYPDGVWLVDLASLTDPRLVPNAVALALGLREDQGSAVAALRKRLRHQTSLIVLDNCEHLREAVASVVSVVLQAGPGVRLLATSRERLGVAGEAVFAVPPLSVPEPSRIPEELLSHGAVKLFIERAALAARDFAMTTHNALAVSSICARLEGLPLAIELAAARMGSLAPDVVARRLDEGLGILAGSHAALPRHETLEATIDWSHRLLTAQERTVFARLSVFAGTFELEAAEEVCSGDGIEASTIPDLLSRLVDKSLVARRQPSAEQPGYRLLDVLRQYAAGRLDETGAVDVIRRRHRDRCLRIAVGLRDGGDRAGWLERLRREHDDMEAALEWSRQAHEAQEAATIATAVGQYWLHHGHPRRAVAQLRATLEMPSLERAPEIEADLRVSLSNGLHQTGDDDAALAEAELARDLLADAAPSVVQANALAACASLYLLVVHQDPRRSIDPARHALAAARGVGDREAEMRALTLLGHATAWTGAPHEGIAHKREALAIALEIGDAAMVLDAYASFFDVLYLHPELRRDGPRRLAEEILSTFDENDARWTEHIPWKYLGYAFLQSGEWERAEDAIKRAERRQVEGYGRMWFHHMHGSLRWMQGRLDEARDDLKAFRRLDPAPRWYHDLFSLAADVAADGGHLDDARASASEYLGVEVHPSEESMKAGVLRPLIRAEVDAALLTTGQEREEHAMRARQVLHQMRHIVARYPSPTGGSLQFETADTNVVLAEGEVSRVTGPDPSCWRIAMARAAWVYWRVYARWRLAESLLETGQREDGTRELRDAFSEASALGAGLVRNELASLARRSQVPLDPRT